MRTSIVWAGQGWAALPVRVKLVITQPSLNADLFPGALAATGARIAATLLDTVIVALAPAAVIRGSTAVIWIFRSARWIAIIRLAFLAYLNSVAVITPSVTTSMAHNHPSMWLPG